MKTRFSIGRDNRLIVSNPGSSNPLKPEGSFNVDRDNRLSYEIKESSSWRKEHGFSKRIFFEGNWKLDSESNLVFSLQNDLRQHGEDCLLFKGKAISVDRGEFVFEVKSYDKYGSTHIELLKLSGFCRSDKLNRLSFEVTRKDSTDTLTFEGVWQLNRNQQIIYGFSKENLKRKEKISKVLTFKGFWLINRANILTYVLEHSSKSVFDFRVQMESPSLYPKEGVIKYRIGIGASRFKRGREKLITLFGAWKFSRTLGILFQMEYEKGKFRNIEFGADISVSPKNNIGIELKNSEGKPLGITIVFTHKFLKSLDGEVFLRVKKIINHEQALEAGLKFPF